MAVSSRRIYLFAGGLNPKYLTMGIGLELFSAPPGGGGYRPWMCHFCRSSDGFPFGPGTTARHDGQGKGKQRDSFSRHGPTRAGTTDFIKHMERMHGTLAVCSLCMNPKPALVCDQSLRHARGGVRKGERMGRGGPLRGPFLRGGEEE